MSYYDALGNIVQVNTYGTTPLASLSAVSASSAGTALDGSSLRTTAVLVVTSSAGVTAGSVVLEGSLDNINWYPLGSAVSTTTASTVFTPVIVNTTAARYVRARVATAITGGTVSASVGMSG